MSRYGLPAEAVYALIGGHENAPRCSCHGLPQCWKKRADLKAGGYWRCPAYEIKHRRREWRMSLVRREKFTRQEIFERDQGLCHYCGEAVDPDGWHLAHLVAIARGGPHTRDNVAVSHPKCNLRAGTTPHHILDMDGFVANSLFPSEDECAAYEPDGDPAIRKWIDGLGAT